MQEHTVNTIREIRQLLKELAQMAQGAKNALALYFMKTHTVLSLGRASLIWVEKINLLSIELLKATVLTSANSFGL